MVFGSSHDSLCLAEICDQHFRSTSHTRRQWRGTHQKSHSKPPIWSSMLTDFPAIYNIIIHIIYRKTLSIIRNLEPPAIKIWIRNVTWRKNWGLSTKHVSVTFVTAHYHPYCGCTATTSTKHMTFAEGQSIRKRKKNEQKKIPQHLYVRSKFERFVRAKIGWFRRSKSGKWIFSKNFSRGFENTPKVRRANLFVKGCK